MIQSSTSGEPVTKEALPASLRSIAEQLEQNRKLQPADMRRILLEAGVKPKELEPWADFDHPVTDSYGRRLIYKGDNFEIMAMSWRPGDFSTIHDHGHTQWGAVQTFGPAEHATFRWDNQQLSTLLRWVMAPGEAVGVHHTLIHQMGNPTTDKFFLTLHVYGEVEDVDNVTGDARVFDLETSTIQRVDGGVFYALPPEQIKRTEPGPVADFPTQLRHLIELIRRVRKMENRNANRSGKDLNALIEDLMSGQQHARLLRCLQNNSDRYGHQSNSVYWRVLNQELKEAARLQNELMQEERKADHFHQYAELYDAVIGRPCLEQFMAGYLRFFRDRYDIDFPNSRLISLGCGTGLVEEYLIENLGLPYDHLFGMDISEAMVVEARKRIQADVGDVLTLDPSIRMWDVAFSGLNVFHYIDHTRLEEAIRNTAAIIRSGGYFIGDFITPDHIRWYPNVLYSKEQDIISLRTPRLVETGGSVFQESEIVNISFRDGRMRVSYAGKHRRFLPPLHRVRTYFERAFGPEVELYDAVSLEPIPEGADSCASTRYIVVAKRG